MALLYQDKLPVGNPRLVFLSMACTPLFSPFLLVVVVSSVLTLSAHRCHSLNPWCKSILPGHV
ncbi:hypothetical protein BDV36DRAFT_116252 [Aspergillus pseudocaelatus]|uniref:Uncharacterized protein n=1 Tax=Aspergillus pseudocaelatus TaxID=1825620 RepID=A0ABQ6W0G9_9EURO|nr:hypothetical protein BDV36DRAFT_116252 [Aspergillus pseudocaelatus]